MGVPSRKDRKGIERHPEGLPTEDNCREVQFILEGECTYPDDGSSPFLTYEDFARARKETREVFGDIFDRCFSARVFGVAACRKYGLVPLTPFLKYLQKYAIRARAKYELKDYCQCGGLLNADGIDAYLKDLSVFERQGASETIASVGRRLGVLKFLFYHANRSGVMHVWDVIKGQTMAELQKVRSILDFDDDEAILDSCWFSKQNAKVIHETFVELDRSKTGQLSAAQFLAYNGAKMTGVFVNRIFEQYGAVGQSGKMMMDMDFFSSFIIGWRDRNSPEAVRYLFPIYDIQGQGYITSMEVYTFIKQIVAEWTSCEPTSYYPQIVEDIVNEIFDLVKPAIPGAISKSDMMRVENSGLMFGIMGDVWEFWHHEHREDQQSQEN
ncbi:hypothetical protein BSKO_00428 [Bryopsis sp. KO-2023]|nr:hypothetical protein BSKO_00428 [Bryopsis sp. KO-2023]